MNNLIATEALVENAAHALYLAYAQNPEARWDAVDPAMQENVWRAHIRGVQAGTIPVVPFHFASIVKEVV